VAALCLRLLTSTVSAQEPVYDGLDVDLASGTLSGFSASVRGHAPLGLVGEAFESLRMGWGGSAALSGFFSDRYAARVRVGMTSFTERLVDPQGVLEDHARLIEVRGELLGRAELGRLAFEAGPAVGYARLSRPALTTTQNGLLAGVGAGTSLRLAPRWWVILDANVSWSSFAAPGWAIAPPAGFSDEGADGRQVALGLGMAYRWGGGLRAPERPLKEAPCRRK
jgi:hypothetical protein